MIPYHLEYSCKSTCILIIPMFRSVNEGLPADSKILRECETETGEADWASHAGVRSPGILIFD